MSITVTFFDSRAADLKRQERWDFDELVDLLKMAPTAKRKEQLPWMKLATFGDKKTPKGSYRFDANVEHVSGVELDYDDGKVSPGEAVNRLNAAGIKAIVYTSPSYTIEFPKWRVLAPFSRDLEPTARRAMAARVDNALGRICAPESFTLSQAYYFGRVEDHPYAVAASDGRYIDQLEPTEVKQEMTVGDGIGERAHTAPTALATLFARMQERGTSAHDNHVELCSVSAKLAAKGWIEEDIYGVLATYGGDNQRELERIISSAIQKFHTPEPAHDDIGAQEATELGTFPPPGPAPDLAAIPARRWILGTRVLQGAVSVLVGVPGAGKTQFAVQSAVAVATGRGDITGEPVHRAGPTLLFSNEEPADELWLRVGAVCDHFEVPYPPPNLHVTSGYESPFRLLGAGKYGDLRQNREGIAELEAYIREHGINYVSVDPMVGLALADENDNSAMEALMTILREVTASADCAVEVIHHTSKGAGRLQDPTDMYAGRGASAVVGAARIVTNLGYMSKGEAAELGLDYDKQEHRQWVWIGAAKGNYAALEARHWCSVEKVECANTDKVAVLVPESDPDGLFGEMKERAEVQKEALRAAKADAKLRPFGVAAKAALESHGGSMTLPEMANAMKRDEKGWAYDTLRRKASSPVLAAIDELGAELGIEYDESSPPVISVGGK